MALTAGGPVVVPKLIDGRNKLFFFGSYSYVNDFIPGKNQDSSTVPASAAQLNGDFSDLLRLPNPAQYQIYDPLTVRPDPANPDRFIRSPFPNNIIPANRIVNPLYNLYRQMVPPPNQNLIENGATPTGNYYRGGEPDKPVSSLYAGRVDYNLSGNDRFFFRFSGNTFIEPVSDWTYEVPEFEGLHSIDRSRYNWAVIGNWTHVAGKTLIDTQVASNRFLQDDKLLRLHDYKPTDIGLPSVPRRLLRGAERLHAARRQHRRLSGHLARRGLWRHHDEPPGHGQCHAGARRAHAARRASMRGWRSASAVRAATPRASSRSPTSSPVRPATRRSSHRAISG